MRALIQPKMSSSGLTRGSTASAKPVEAMVDPRVTLCMPEDDNKDELVIQEAAQFP